MSIAYTERLAEAGAVTSVGSRGDSYDNAAAESLIGLFKTELIRSRGPWKGLDDVELATLEWADWFNHRRPHSHCGDVRPAEFEATHYRQQAPAESISPGEPSIELGRFRVMDAIVPAMLLAMTVGRFGCFFGGCCAGRPTGGWDS